MKFKKILRIFLNILFWCFTLSIAALAVLLLIYGNDLPDYKKLATYAPPVATRLYASDGSLLIEYAEERRVFIDFADMPSQLVNAFVAAEDQNFWTHPGIDIQGIARAAVNNGLRLMGFDARFSGASTITQQVAKNFFLTSERTISRKIKEAILAMRLERTFSKQHIMTLYLNQIFLGARAYGVGSAALMYFNKPVSELTLSECAFLASLPKAPNNRDRAVERRNYVLRRMVEEGYITQSAADAAAAEPLNINSGFTAQMAPEFQYFAEDVRRQLLETLGRETLYNEGLYIKTTIVPELQRAATAALNKELDQYNSIRGSDEPKLQGAIIAMNPHTGRILAMSGGRDFAESSFNRATQAMRQIGSTIKPFVYLAALERGMSPQALILDAPIVGWRENNTLWKPENYDKKFLGDVPLRLALETSRNVPAVRLVQTLGVENAIEVAQRFGVYPQELENINLSLALGSGETTLERLVLGYSAFVNGGRVIQPKLVDYIEDRYGRVLGGAGPEFIEWQPDLLPPEKMAESEPLSDPQSLYQMVSILQGTVERGTGRQARVPGHTIAGKTGTTNDVKDIWFVGFSKNLIAGVYLGFDTPRPLGRGAGSHMAARVFADFMKTALANAKNQPFSVPDGLTFVRVNRRTGVAAAEDPNGTIITEAFKPGQHPNPAPQRAARESGPAVGGVF
ncbi:MAG: PBP1A family penicillin-binding protein [Proteobacteria bacterium]|uniref:peptidoglycan glycosyltransferase n=1 Tax=Candidatus Enterousia avistercoris TaxID=2840788 RepID=A0A9D9DF34_9PROT|nr:PBP1A family penicillin-binding protein [Candidatus Enterousia avistercoris]